MRLALRIATASLLAATLAGRVALAAGPGSISGRIQGEGGVPLANVPVEVYDLGGKHVASASTDAAGRYATAAELPVGTYYVRTAIRTWDPSSPPYFDRLYDAVSCDPTHCLPSERGAPVLVTAGADTPGIDITLPRGGRISGLVLHEVTLAGVRANIAVLDADGRLASTAQADATGAFTTAKGLPTGEYSVSVTGNPDGLINEIYDDVCALCEPVAGGRRVGVVAGSTTAGIDFALQPGGSITGRLTSTSSVHGRFVYVFGASGRYVGNMPTDASGAYDSARALGGLGTGLPTGDYFVKTYSRESLDVDELFDDIPCPWTRCNARTGTRVHVDAPRATPRIDFSLAQGGVIEGRARGPEGSGLPGAVVTAWLASGGYVGEVRGDASGNYLLPRLSGGDYLLRAEIPAERAGSGSLGQLYDGIPCQPSCDLRSGTPVRVTRGLYTSGIDFTLEPGAQIEGYISDAVTGRPVYAPCNIFVESGPVSGYWSGWLEPGRYVSTVLTPTKHFARTYDPLGTVMPRYRSRLFDGRDCGMYGSCDPRLGTRLGLTTGGILSGVDFKLVRQRRQSDFDDDRTTDPAVFEPATGRWRAFGSHVYWLAEGAIGITGDFDGDNRSDAAAFVPSAGGWVIRDRYEGTTRAFLLGGPSDHPVPSDYDGDGKTDAAVFDPRRGKWGIKRSATGAVATVTFGAGADAVPVPGDYDGDGMSDLAVFQRVSFLWRILESSSGRERIDALAWAAGCSGCLAAPGDYDDDGRQDLALFEPGSATWTIQQSSDGVVRTVVHGDPGAVPVPGDYDADGRADPATYLETTGEWKALPSRGGPALVFLLGGPGHVPVF